MGDLVFHIDERGNFDRTFVIGEDALKPDLEIVLLDDANKAVDISGETFTFSMEDREGVVKIADDAGAAFQSDGTDGKLKFVFSGTQTDAPKTYFGQFQSTNFKIPNNLTQKLIIKVAAKVN